MCVHIWLYYSVVSKMATGYIAGGAKATLMDLGWIAPTGQMYSTINDLLTVIVTYESPL